MLKLAGEVVDKYLGDHEADLDAHIYNMFERLRTGVYYPSPLLCKSPGSTAAIEANQLYAIAFLVARPLTVDYIGIVIATGATGKKARLGIYGPGTNLYPGSQVKDAGEVDVSTNGVKAIQINQALVRGINWFVFVSDGTPAIYYEGTYFVNLVGYDTTAGSITWKVAFTYDALPATFPSGGASQYGKGWCMCWNLASMD